MRGYRLLLREADYEDEPATPPMPEKASVQFLGKAAKVGKAQAHPFSLKTERSRLGSSTSLSAYAAGTSLLLT